MEKFKDQEEIKDIFKTILNVDVEIKDNIEFTEKIIFLSLVDRLENSFLEEVKLLADKKITISYITVEYWNVVLDLIRIVYGEDTSSYLHWYVFERFDDNGILTPIRGIDGKDYLIHTPEELWNFILTNPFDSYDEEEDEEDDDLD
tara:strand:- start:2012 stop:2449 length:438 start_codon:yes stop_codon:yes gene_type:complete